MPVLERAAAEFTDWQGPGTGVLEVIRTENNSARLHRAMGHVTPGEEHAGRGKAIREGPTRAVQDRHRNQRRSRPSQKDPDMV